MKCYYFDIISRIKDPILWFDENAVPRYIPFHPNLLANIYATECCLILIECQSCKRPFTVAKSINIEDQVEHLQHLHYCDPPNVECCDVGMSMNSEPIRVLQFWVRDNTDWKRIKELELEIDGNTCQLVGIDFEERVKFLQAYPEAR